jgi:hypothetical protein
MKTGNPSQAVQVISPPVSTPTVHWIKKPRIPSAELQRLRRLAKKYRPPQSWYDESGDCPFVPADK